MSTTQVRSCGTCSACCRWPSIKEINKPARQPCKHLHEQGFRCTIYVDRPKTCVKYHCSWMRGMGFKKDRPDICGVLIDRRGTQFGIVLVAKSVVPNATMLPDGRKAIDRASRDGGLPCLVVSEDDAKQVIGVSGSQDFIREVQSNAVDGVILLQIDWMRILNNVVADAMKGKVSESWLM